MRKCLALRTKVLGSTVWNAGLLIGLLICELSFCHSLLATDYFLTIGGGYSPSGNEATLEANVQFFQRVLQDKHPAPRVHEVFFADGFDTTPDLLIATPDNSAPLPATELLASLHRRGESALEYRNHQVTDITGASDPALIRAGLAGIARAMKRGDRLMIYVTAHGSAAPRRDPYNTTINCWNDTSITVREFTRWLDELSPDVPVLMVMAQCYCGGFAGTIFKGGDESRGLAKHVRAGFFAQQHDLPAAGCRPDIDNDEEFSSYFWGAVVGRRRTGEPITGCDLDGNGTVSFSEAYVHAMVTGETIDIPLRASDVLLQTYSWIAEKAPADGNALPAGENPVSARESGTDKGAASVDPAAPSDPKLPGLYALAGTVENIVAGAHSANRNIVAGLIEQLGMSLSDDVSTVMAAYKRQQELSQSASRGPRRRAGSGRREFLAEVAAKWPELADRRRWETSPLLRSENQEKLLAELKQLPNFGVYDQRRREQAEREDAAERNELREVKYRRLIDTLKVIVLTRNLSMVATSDVVQRFQEMVALEDSSLAPPPATN